MTASPMTTSAFWDERYAEPGFAYGDTPNAFLASVASRLRPGGRVLVPGDGEGRNGVWLAMQGFEVLTVDISQEGCAKARRMADARGVRLEIMCADLLDWRWPVGTMDAVVSIFLHLPPAMRTEAHRRMRDALAPEGCIVIEAFDVDHLPLRQRQPSVGGPADSAMLYTLPMLAADFAPLRAGLAETVEVELSEGRYHTGRGSVVRAVFE
jgi:SAM-dependent methyltransferase